jgi:hypothetical protein
MTILMDGKNQKAVITYNVKPVGQEEDIDYLLNEGSGL